MKVVFMGTPHFAVGCLEKIFDSKHEVVAVITAPDKAAGRGRKIQESAVKKYAIANNLTLLQPTNLKSETFINELKSLHADIFVVVAFRMLPKIVWEIPPKGTFNLHASLLPDYRGAAPINWAIINGEQTSGVTTFLIDEKIDTGNILHQEKIELDETETAGSLHDKLMVLGAEVIIHTLNGLENNKITAKPQPKVKQIKHAPKIQKEDCRINWFTSLELIDQFIRGFSPYPTAWTSLKNQNKEIHLKVFSGSFKYAVHQNNIGDVIIEKKVLKIATKEGYYFPIEIQAEGKKRMRASDFSNGLNLNEKYYVS